MKIIPWSFEIKRNKAGWLASARLTLRAMFWAPSMLWWLSRDTVLIAAGALIMLPVVLLTSVVWLGVQIVGGLFGFLSQAPVQPDEVE